MLQASGPISMSQLRTELGAFGPINLGRSDSRALSVKPTGAVKISNFYSKYQELPQIEAFLYDSTTAFDAFISAFTPPTNQQIFNTWGRFAGNTWFPSGVTPTGEAAAWSYDSVLDRCVCTMNTTAVVGFVSTEKLDNYVLETTLSSTNADDDVIGVLIAFYYDGVNNNYLYACRVNYTTSNWYLRVVNGAAGTLLVNGTNSATLGFQNTALQGWLASGPTRVKVQRAGDLITAVCSPFGSLVYDESTSISFDLSTNVKTQMLIGKQSYGYMASSQNAATFSESVLSGALASDMAFNTAANVIKKYNATTMQWEVQAGSIATLLGYPRKVLNPNTGSLFSISPTGVITKIS